MSWRAVENTVYVGGRCPPYQDFNLSDCATRNATLALAVGLRRDPSESADRAAISALPAPTGAAGELPLAGPCRCLAAVPARASGARSLKSVGHRAGHRDLAAVGLEPDLPSAPHRPVDLDQAQGDLSAGLGPRVFLADQIRLDHGVLIERGGSAAESVQPDHEGPFAGFRTFAELVGAVLRFQERDQAVLYFPIGLDHGVLVSDDEFLEPGVLEADAVDDPSLRRDFPGAS